MAVKTEDEFFPLVLPNLGRKQGYTEIDNESKDIDDHNKNRHWKIPFFVWTIVAILLFVFVVDEIDSKQGSENRHHGFGLRSLLRPKCQFCNQSPPTLHEDRSYILENGAVVTPMTVTYDYELRDGQMLYTNSRVEHIPNLNFDYAVLGMSSVRNLHRDTNTPVSLDEVYVHHFSIFPLNMIGAEVLTRSTENPYMLLPDGYALHVTLDETPVIRTNAHLLSNKNLAPIEGSIARAHKECNECYYAPGKGSDCTPETSGTFYCCGDSHACTMGGEDCSCAVTATDAEIATKYRVEVDLLISKDMDKFVRVDQWNFAAPACTLNILGEGIFEDYPLDNFCSDLSPSENLEFGGGSLFHNVARNDERPLVQTKLSAVAPIGGKVLWAQSHLHTGGINATLRLNGHTLCATTTQYGTDPNIISNARNEANHLVEITSCYDQIGSNGIRFDQGDVFTIESIYYAGTDDHRMTEPEAAGEHKNVMSMFFTAIEFDGTTELLTEKRTSWNLWNHFAPIAGRKFEIRKQLKGLQSQ